MSKTLADHPSDRTRGGKLPRVTVTTSKRVVAGGGGKLPRMAGATAKRVVIGRNIFISFYEAEPLQRVDIIQQGLSAEAAKQLLAGFQTTTYGMLDALKIPVTTFNRKARTKALLSSSESERVLGVAGLIQKVQEMVEQSGRPEGFDAGQWLSKWLEEPLPALGGRRPVEFLDTMEGQSLVSASLARMQSGTYA